MPTLNSHPQNHKRMHKKSSCEKNEWPDIVRERHLWIFKHMHQIRYAVQVRTCNSYRNKPLIKHPMLIDHDQIFCSSQKTSIIWVIYILHANCHYIQSIRKHQSGDAVSHRFGYVPVEGLVKLVEIPLIFAHFSRPLWDRKHIFQGPQFDFDFIRQRLGILLHKKPILLFENLIINKIPAITYCIR